MASKNPPVKNEAYSFRIRLYAQSDNKKKINPTIAAGDFKVSTDGGTYSNLTTTPSESPANSGWVLVSLSASEMNGDDIAIDWLDASGDEWWDNGINIHPVTNNQFDDLATAALIGTPAGADVSTDIASIIAYVDSLETRLTDARAGYLDSLNGHVAQSGDSFVRLGAPALASVSADILAIAGSIPSYSGIASAVAEEALSGHTTPGTVGKTLADILADSNQLVADDIPALIAGLNDPTAAAIAQAVLSQDVATIEDTAAVDSLAAIILATLYGEVSGTTFNIYKTDGATIFSTKTVVLSPTADPITKVS